MGVTSVRLSVDIETPLEDLAKRSDRSKNYIINQAIKEFIARKSMEEAQWLDTQAALESVQSGRFIHEKKVKAWLESWGQHNEKTQPRI